MRYHVSIRFTHPEITPDEITEAMGLEPGSVDYKGDSSRYRWAPERMRGLLRAKHRWFHMFEPRAPSESLTDRLRSAIAHLQDRRAFLERVHDSGGRVEFTVILFPPSGRNQPFDYSLITELLELGIGFKIQMIPRDDYRHDPTDFRRG